MWSVKKIANAFFDIESKFNLNHEKIHGVYFWQLVRMYLYYDVARKLNTFGSAQQQSLTIIDKINSFLPFIKNSIKSNPFSGKDKVDVLIFDHPRKVMYQDQYRDIYTCFLTRYLEEYSKSYEIIESPYLNKHYTNKSKNIRYNDRILLGSYIHKKTNSIHFNDEEKELIQDIYNEFLIQFNIHMDNLEDIIEDHILNFEYEYEKYKKLILKKSPKQVYVVVAYENKALVAACQDLGVEVLELQHGTISNYHLGYSYPNEHIVNVNKNNTLSTIEYFPDKLLSFGDYWADACTYPIKKNNIIPLGYPYFEECSKDFVNIKKNKNQILFISQGVIGKYLSKFAYELLVKLNNRNVRFKIVYKLHPGEYENWKVNYPELLEASESSNFEVVDDSKTPLYKLFAESQYQVGAFSTAIYEGLQFDCKTFIVDLPGVEYVENLIEENIVRLVSSVNDLINNLDFTPKTYDKDYIFKSFDEDLFRKIIY